MFYTFCRFFEKLQMYFYTNFRYCIDCEYLPASRKEAQISNSMLFYIRLFLFHLCLYTFVCVCAHKIQQTAFSLSDTRIMIFARIHDGISQSKSLRLTVTHRQSQVLPSKVRPQFTCPIDFKQAHTKEKKYPTENKQETKLLASKRKKN